MATSEVMDSTDLERMAAMNVYGSWPRMQQVFS